MPSAKADFERERIETYVPYRVVDIPGKPGKYKKVPMMESLIFLKTTASFLRTYKKDHPTGMMYYRDLDTGGPGVIQDEEMEIFRKVTSLLGQGVEFFEDDSPEFHTGEAVEVTEGEFKGYKGNICRIGRDRKVVITIASNFSFRLDIHPRYLRSLENDK